MSEYSLPRRRFLGAAAIAACASVLPRLATAQSSGQGQGKWPERPVRIILPYPPGGNVDIITRLIAQPLTQTLGQQFIVENRPGGNGTIALDAVARAPADGYTLLSTAVAQLAIVPQVMKTRYDPVADFAPIGIITSNPLVLVVGNKVPARTLREFVDYARGLNAPVQFAHSGEGGIPHLTTVLFAGRAGLQVTHVPYKGSGQVLSDMIGGHIPAYFANVSEVLPHAAKGDLRLLAQTGDRRAAQLPDVPTVAEQGYPGFHSQTWSGLLAPAGTPAAIIRRISEIVVAATRDASIAARMAAAGVLPLGGSPEQLSETLRADIASWGAVLRTANVKPE